MVDLSNVTGVQAAQEQMEAARIRNENGTGRDPNLGFHKDQAAKDEAMRRSELALENYKLAKEADLEKEKVKRGLSSKGSGAPRQLVGRELGSVSMRAIEWLWTGWIPKGYITLLAGETGAGKSTVFCDVSARVTTGAPWPGEYDCPNAWRKPERVMWLGSEDSIEEMTVPRLVACGANLANVVEIQGVMQEGKRNTFSMQDDLEQVAQWLTIARDQGNPFAMLVIDPVTSYLPGQKLRKVDLNDAGQLSHGLGTLADPCPDVQYRHRLRDPLRQGYEPFDAPSRPWLRRVRTNLSQPVRGD